MRVMSEMLKLKMLFAIEWLAIFLMFLMEQRNVDDDY